MHPKDAIRYLLQSNQGLVKQYLSDLSDADLLVRPTPGANHIAWQLGHLISSEATFFLAKIPGAKPPELPAGFSAAHEKETAGSDSPRDFRTKAEYLELYDKTRQATLAAVDQLADADLDKPTGMDFAPTLGTLLVMVGNHDMMHAGQFTTVRRKLGKPVLF